jgi:hypothetical protein
MQKQRWMCRSLDRQNSRSAEGVDNPFDAMRQAFGCVMPVEVKAIGRNAAVMRTNWLREEFFANDKGWLKPFAIRFLIGPTTFGPVYANVWAEDEIRAVQLIKEKDTSTRYAEVKAEPTDSIFSDRIFFQEVEYKRPERKRED